jgi:hypothetical protein
MRIREVIRVRSWALNGATAAREWKDEIIRESVIGSYAPQYSVGDQVREGMA